MRRLKIAK